uniref:DNA polymerase epsilon subunit 4 n=1 Tax=Lygus hesperus TaxID=30085 RepID=A0A0K8SZS8_LYGHE
MEMDSGDIALAEIMDELIDDPSESTNGALAETELTEDMMQTETEELDVENVNSENQSSVARAAKSKVCELPLSKIKGIMKMDPEVVMVGSEAVFAVAKAAELFLQTLAKQSFKHTAAQKKKTVQRSHVDSAVTGSDGLFFLEDALD